MPQIKVQQLPVNLLMFVSYFVCEGFAWSKSLEYVNTVLLSILFGL